LAPDSFTSFAHFAFSRLTAWPSACGLLVWASAPSPASLACASGVANPLTRVALRLSMIARGVAAGANTPYQVLTS
jgi:hypothetical protein